MALDNNRPKNYRRAWNGGRDLIKQPLTADEWNAQYPVGTPVIVVKDHGELWETKTRSVAWNLSHGQPVVMLEGKSGGYDLSRVSPTGAVPETLRPHIEELCDSIDAAVFTGDQFEVKPARARLRFYMARWEKELRHLDEADSAVDTEGKSNG